MKNISLKLSLLLGAALLAMNLSAFAGPDGRTFRPVKSREELSVLTPGTEVAHECPHCGTIEITKADKDKAHAESHTCPECKMKVTYQASAGGKSPAPNTRTIECKDEKTGKTMSAKVCAAHK